MRARALQAAVIPAGAAQTLGEAAPTAAAMAWRMISGEHRTTVSAAAVEVRSAAEFGRAHSKVSVEGVEGDDWREVGEALSGAPSAAICHERV